MKPEAALQRAVCDYLRLAHPNVMFMISASGIKLTMGQAKSLKANQNPSRGWPDLLIMHGNQFHGLFIELKPEGYKLYKRDGTFRKNEHVENQNRVHQMLRDRGYEAEFAVGFDQAKSIIDKYISLSNEIY